MGIMTSRMLMHVRKVSVKMDIFSEISEDEDPAEYGEVGPHLPTFVAAPPEETCGDV